jgi:hypothetical protein
VNITKFIIEPALQAGTFHGVVAGTFWLSASHSPNEIVNIEDGKFEIEFWK